MRVVATGGAGYIGRHTVLRLLRDGHDVLVIDDFSNASRDVIARLTEETGRRPQVLVADVRDVGACATAMARFRAESVIHFAGLKDVAASVQDPARYHAVNVGGVQGILDAMTRAGCETLVFSSSAAVYGAPQTLPIPEAHPLRPLSPYGETKRLAEQLVSGWARAAEGRRAVSLRYFNPAGAAPALIRPGDEAPGCDSLVARVSEVAAGLTAGIEIFGSDYDTPDGTGLRDFLHIDDLVAGHLAVLARIEGLAPGTALNLGSGGGATVLELLRCYERVSGCAVPHSLGARRAGDIPASWADTSAAQRLLGWRARHDLAEICASAWTAVTLAAPLQRSDRGMEYSNAIYAPSSSLPRSS
ncbi:UDP-glucose 4-epimerase GalE [Salipiger sp. P9]|uniref:UDP-glucose 4-epimerase GalE n=1 Tax=Salipiger pentaromativorans TaxID=2943193 RepID=UPI0021587B6B|nr:UDP-glucose 4-epimerase GalE [Salipiger pentaromativorans]MCR8548667.1 UDP-glucose 4-epimerase GalE [Salipiger pentaromativorans]